jgi:hypothetical protein
MNLQFLPWLTFGAMPGVLLGFQVGKSAAETESLS